MLSSPTNRYHSKSQAPSRVSGIAEVARVVFALVGLFSTAIAPAAIGPFDFRDPVALAQYKYKVESVHFTASVQALTKGATGSVWADLDYTLAVFPNHPSALYVMSELFRKKATSRHEGKLDFRRYFAGMPPERSNAEFYFDRAAEFAPDDDMVWLVYGIHFHREKQYHKALTSYQKALEINPRNPEIHYNMGLSYFELRDYKNAEMHGGKAYEAGYPLQGLKKKLAAVGVTVPASPSDTAKD